MIFVVDSDQNVCSSLAKLANTEGFATTTYVSGRDFLSSANPESGDVIVLDMETADLSGIEVKEILLQHRVAANTIITSTRDYPEAPKLAQKLGAIGYFSKPVDGAALIDYPFRAMRWLMTRPFFGGKGYRELKRGTLIRVFSGPDLAAVGLDYRSAYGQTHPQPRRFRRVERFEQAFCICLVETSSRIAY